MNNKNLYFFENRLNEIILDEMKKDLETNKFSLDLYLSYNLIDIYGGYFNMIQLYLNMQNENVFYIINEINNQVLNNCYPTFITYWVSIHLFIETLICDSYDEIIHYNEKLLCQIIYSLDKILSKDLIKKIINLI